MQPDLSVRGITQRYGSKEVIHRLDLDIGSGIVGLLGPNGAGKTTLLKTLSTVMPPREGSIFVRGRKIGTRRSLRRARRQIGYLPQKFGYYPNFKLRDFIAYSAWLRGVPAGETPTAVENALDLVDLADESGSRMRTLSGGMIQRAGIAWAIVGDPEIVLLDEPSVGLDPEQRVRFRQIMAGLTASVVVLSTHLIEDVTRVCDRVLVFGDGTVRYDGDVDGIRGHAPLGTDAADQVESGYVELVGNRQAVR